MANALKSKIFCNAYQLSLLVYLLAAFNSNTSHAGEDIDFYIVSSDTTVRVVSSVPPGFEQVASDRDNILIEPDGSGGSEQLILFNDLDGVDVDAFFRGSNGALLYSLDKAVEINSKWIFPGDVLIINPGAANPPGILLDSSVLGIPDGINLDALGFINDSDQYIVSYDRSFNHPALGTVFPNELIETNVSGSVQNRIFVNLPLPENVNLDAVHWINGDTILFSIDIDARLPTSSGLQNFSDDDIIQYDAISGNLSRVLSLSEDAHPSWQQADLDALYAERILETGQFRFTKSILEVQESTSDPELTVERVGGSEGSVEIRITAVGGSAVDGTDFSSSPIFLNWPNGDSSSRTFSNFTIIDDTLEESIPETLTVQLSIESGNATLGNPSTITINIMDNDGDNIFADGFDG